MNKFSNTISVIMLTVVFCNSGCNKPQAPEGAINGIFSVSPTEKVYFSQGNLQYQASTDTWRFAEHQWDYVGGVDRYDRTFYGNVVGSDNNDISKYYSGWIDLFGWGTSGWNNGNKFFQPYDCETSYFDYGPVRGRMSFENLGGDYCNADWGEYNRIINGGNQAGLWRTLSSEEWVYLFNKRKTVSGIRYVLATVNSVPGVVVFPDNWKTNEELTCLDFNGDCSNNCIKKEIWDEVFESKGAVFLPAAGNRNGRTLWTNGSHGCYWSSTYGESYFAFCVNFGCDKLYPDDMSGTFGGSSVRLVYSAN